MKKTHLIAGVGILAAVVLTALLLGGICGLLRGLVVAVLVLCVMPTARLQLRASTRLVWLGGFALPKSSTMLGQSVLLQMLRSYVKGCLRSSERRATERGSSALRTLMLCVRR